MDGKMYRLRCTIAAHSRDIRAVSYAFDPVGGLISGSRDTTIKVWRPNRSDSEFQQVSWFQGATHYISSLCVLPPSEHYPHGLILAGSHDCAIYGFSLESSEPVLKLLGHSGNVCALAAGNLGTVVSGSWDKTARVWFGQMCVATLTGHSQAVWAVAILPDHAVVLTGSADKTICLWRSDKCERTFTGHKDCVRGLAVVSDKEFLSCSNDSTIMRWQIGGNCVGIYTGHTDYIYDICMSRCGDFFVSCGEDQTVKVWKDSSCIQTINLPAKSLWAITSLRNNDIAVGGSDGTIRVFTRHVELMASPSQEAMFLEEVKINSKTTQKNIGDLELNDLIGTEALLQDGTSDGQTQLCKVGTEVFAFQWSAEEKKWKKLGKVLDAVESKPSTGKVMYKGKEYDHVFNIEVQEGELLKLPYNESEDPWLVAHQFIEDYNLNKLFLDQVANFIIKNSKQAQKQHPKPELSDPFTGSSRYIPSTPGNLLPASLHILETSDSAQVSVLPKTSSSGSGDAEKPQKEVHFPVKAYLSFENANLTGIRTKLCEFTLKVEKPLQLTAEEIDALLALCIFPKEVTDQQMMSLEKVLSWPIDLVFPALDVLRLAVRTESINCRISKDGGIGLLNHLFRYLGNTNPASNQMLVLKTLCNFFTHSSGKELLVKNAKKILQFSKSCFVSQNKHVQIALSTLYVNYALAFVNSTNPNDCQIKDTYLYDAVDSLKCFSEPEAIFRLLVCIGTEIHHDKRSLEVAVSMRITHIVRSIIDRYDVHKIKDAGNSLICLLST